LTRFVRAPFTAQASFDFAQMAEVAAVAVRMLDNVLDATSWPLPEQGREAATKRRIGLGMTGLGDALIMLGMRYDTAPAREFAASVAAALRDAAYEASVQLATERGAFALFDAQKYLESGFARRLPERIRALIRTHGIRNSHLLSIAPTGTISLAFADNASNGVEPPFSWTYQRRKRMPDGTTRTYVVEDHAWRVYKAMGGDVQALPPAFVSALEISALDHMWMVSAIAPYVDAAISKTVNVPAEYPFEDFTDLYAAAWRAGLKGITTYRPSAVRGAVLVADPPSGAQAQSSAPAVPPEAMKLPDEADRRLVLKPAAMPPLASMRWPSRPRLPAGAGAWVSDTVVSPLGDFVLAVADLEGVPFEVWVLRGEAPRGLDALAKTLSTDLRCNDRAWLRRKLSILRHTEDVPLRLAMPPAGREVVVPGAAAALAALLDWRCGQLGLWNGAQTPSPVLDAMYAPHEPKTGTDGTLAWVADVQNPSTGDEFKLILTELEIPGHGRRPYGVWLTGQYPRTLDALAKMLSLDMRVIDPAWVGLKLRKLLSYAEPRGDFLARVPGSEKQRNYPSTVAYIARLIVHRYAMLGVLDADGYPVRKLGMLEQPLPEESPEAAEPAPGPLLAGAKCRECGAAAVVRRDGCEFCTACGTLGACG
jgi:ribonucleoside-diphosphate reductase alpha chain